MSKAKLTFTNFNHEQVAINFSDCNAAIEFAEECNYSLKDYKLTCRCNNCQRDAWEAYGEARVGA